MPQRSYRMLWDLRLISFQQRFMSPVWLEPPPLSLRHSVPSSCPSPSTADWHGTQWHPGHEGRPAAAGGQNKTKVIRYCYWNIMLCFPVPVLFCCFSALVSFLSVLALVPPLVISVVYVSLNFPSLFLFKCLCPRLSPPVLLVYFSICISCYRQFSSSWLCPGSCCFWICPVGSGFVCLFCGWYLLLNSACLSSLSLVLSGPLLKPLQCIPPDSLRFPCLSSFQRSWNSNSSRELKLPVTTNTTPRNVLTHIRFTRFSRARIQKKTWVHKFG